MAMHARLTSAGLLHSLPLERTRQVAAARAAWLEEVTRGVCWVLRQAAVGTVLGCGLGLILGLFTGTPSAFGVRVVEGLLAGLTVGVWVGLLSRGGHQLQREPTQFD
jgi:hypothetical protein